jgi:16S rRNA (guanine1207-N2)-methyltransferase
VNETDLYFKKTIDFWDDGVALTFRVSQALFSSHQVDTGTQRLLKTVFDLPLKEGAKILDLGCGYGPIGLALAKRYPDSYVHMVDRDALAVDYARQNAAINKLDNCLVYGSLGYDDVVERDFDLIISNIPGKAGEVVITTLLEKARHYLKPGGLVAIVIVAPLEAMIELILDQPEIEVLHQSVFKGHVVVHYRFNAMAPVSPDFSGFESGVYHRGSVALSIGEHDSSFTTAYGLPEFDSLDYQTDLVIKALLNSPPASAKHVVICNPGQGYIPVILWRMLNPDKVIVVSRDLLSLRYTALNLQANGCPADCVIQVHQTGWKLPQANDNDPISNEVDIVVGVLRDDEGPAVNDAVVSQTASYIQVGGTLLVAGGSTPITRVLKRLELDKSIVLKKRRKFQGNSVAILQRR